MADTSVVFNILAKDSASPVLGKVGKAMSSLLMGAGFAVGNAAISGLGKAFDFAKDSVFGFNSTLQNSQIAFTTMLGSGQKAQGFLTDLQNFAKATPFQFEGLVQNAQQMMGMGIAAKDVIPTLRALGDSVASVGGSAEQVNQVTLAFDQMAAKGTLDMGNMNQLLEGGVPNALRILADSYHVTTGQMIQMISTGKVQSSEALPKLINGIEHGTTSVKALGGMMDKQSQTFTGALSNISDGLQQALAGAFRPFFDVASSGAQKLGTFFSGNTFAAFGNKVSGAMSKALAVLQSLPFKAMGADLLAIGRSAAKVFGPALQLGIGAVIGALKGIKPTLDAIRGAFDFMARHSTTFGALAVGITAVVAAMTAWNVITKIVAVSQGILNAVMAMNPIGLIVLAIVGLVAAFAYLWTHSAAFRNFWIGLWGDIWGFLKAVGGWFAGPFTHFFVAGYQAVQHAAGVAINWLHSAWSDVINFFTGMPGRIAAAARGMWNGILSAFRGMVNAVIDIWNRLHFTLPSVDFLGWHTPSLTIGVPHLPHLAAGGMVTAGGLAKVGERGAEVVSLPTGAAVYPHGTVPAGGGGPMRMEFGGDTSGAFAVAFRQLVRVGAITLTDSAGQQVRVA